MPPPRVAPQRNDCAQVQKSLAPSRTPSRWSQLVEPVVGAIYIAVSVFCSAWYCTYSAPYLTNDMWWPRFNTTGTQTFLADVVNSKLATTDAVPVLDLCAANSAMNGHYDLDTSVVTQSPVYPRHYMLGPHSGFEDAIKGMRMTTLAFNLRMFTQYCWLDFDKKYPMAHTAERQVRCDQSEGDNAAVHVEALLRNVKWKDFVSGVGGPAMAANFERPLAQYPGGTAWMESVKDAFVDVPTEVAYWKSKNMTRWQLQWQNAWQQGVDETITVVSALGMSQDLAIKRVPYFHRGSGPWTSVAMYSGLWNEIGRAVVGNFSLIRGSKTHYSLINFTFEMAISFSPTSVQTVLWHRDVGTYNSIDMKYMSIPASVDVLMSSYRQWLVPALQTSLGDTYNAIPDVVVDPAPPAWARGNFSFYGGNPLCFTGKAQPYIQQNFGFDDACLTQDKLSMALTRSAIVFALKASGAADIAAITKICSLTSARAACLSSLQPALDVAASIPMDMTRLVAAVAADVPTVQLMQFAMNRTTSTPVLLRQLLLDPNDPSWSFYGWIQLFDWALNRREVVSFEGDISALPLMSRAYTMQSFQPNPLQVPHSASDYVIVLSAYVSVQLGMVALLLLAYGLLTRSHVLGRNLFRFNRVVGSIWVGRLILLVRGITACMLLCTAPIAMTTSSRGWTTFEFAERGVVESAIVVGEATWILYVIHDFLGILTIEYGYYYAPISTALAWISILALELASPLQATASLHRTCSTLVMGKQIACSSGRVDVGSVDRLYTIFGIFGGSVVVAMIAAIPLRHRRRHTGANMVLGGISETFLDPSKADLGDGMKVVEGVALDNESCVMCGLLVYRVGRKVYVFDLKLWIVFDAPSNGTDMPPITRFHSSSVKRIQNATTALTHPSNADSQNRFRWKDRVRAALGFVYMLGALTGMVLYLLATGDNMANDFWWKGFNSTGTHAYLGNWYNLQLFLTPHASSSVSLTDTKYADTIQYNTTSTVIAASQVYSRIVQFEEANELATAIHGLRAMDACLAPWISTQYCWLDFNRQHPMANTERRQQRCEAAYATNAAVYLESILRNVQWDRFQSCWGSSFETGFATELRSTQAGTDWLLSTQKRTPTVAEEVAVWTQANLVEYTTQYQNYKSVGITETFYIQNSFGISYSMSLKASKGTFQLGLATTLKLYWTFASDLWAVTAPTTAIVGKSLLRRSANFAFANTSVESVLAANGTVSLPFGISFTSFRRLVGPFGSVDARHVVVPSSVRTLYKTTMEFLLPLLSSPDPTVYAQVNFTALPMVGVWSAVPKAWLSANRSIGGSLLCPEQPPYPGALLSYWQDGGCSSAIRETGQATRLRTFTNMLALGLAEVPPTTLQAICKRETFMMATCVTHLTRFQWYIKTYVPQPVRDAIFAMGQSAQKELTDNTRIGMYQILPQPAPLTSYEGLFQPLFDPADPEFYFFGWQFVLEWLVGQRDVVSFEGDAGSVTVLSYILNTVDTLPSPLEVPYNVAFYFRSCVMYATGVLVFVASMVTYQVILSRGHIEGWNVRKINRVGGVIWIGRPLLFLRSLLAVCLISTDNLTLVQFGPIGATSAFAPSPLPWYKVILVSLEVIWFSDVVGDVMVVITKVYTMRYSLKSIVLIWLTTVILTFASPVAHSATINRQCSVVHVDFQLTCTAGTLYVGSFARFCTLLCVSLASTCLCYLYERIRNPQKDTSSANDSILLSSGARYLFQLHQWQYNGYCFLDKASGVINGVLCIEVGESYYILDIKLWKLFVVDLPQDARVPPDHPMHSRLRCAFPLLEHA